jgi:hypothetical protein
MDLSLLETPPVVQLLENFPAFYGTQRFITVLTKDLHWSPSLAHLILLELIIVTVGECILLRMYHE